MRCCVWSGPIWQKVWTQVAECGWRKSQVEREKGLNLVSKTGVHVLVHVGAFKREAPSPRPFNCHKCEWYDAERPTKIILWRPNKIREFYPRIRSAYSFWLGSFKPLLNISTTSFHISRRIVCPAVMLPTCRPSPSIEAVSRFGGADGNHGGSGPARLPLSIV